MTNPSSPLSRANRRTRLVAMACAAGLLLFACSSDGGSSGGGDAIGSSETEQQALLAALADDVIIPGYQQLAGDFDALQGAVDDLCATPGVETLDATRDAWRTTAGSWQQMRPAATGPAMDDRLMSAIGFAARPETIDELLAGDEPVDEAGLAQTGANVRGLNAVEYALFADDAEVLAEPGAPGDRRCQYVSSVVALSATAAHQVSDDWEPYRETFVSSTGSAIESSLARTLNEVTHRIQELDERALRDMAAADTYDDLAAARQDGPAAYTLGERKALLLGIAAVLGDTEEGIAAFVEARSPETADRLVAATEKAVGAFDALPDSVEAAYEDTDAIAEAADAIAELKVVISTEVAAQLGVTVTFSDADGDA